RAGPYLSHLSLSGPGMHRDFALAHVAQARGPLLFCLESPSMVATSTVSTLELQDAYAYTNSRNGRAQSLYRRLNSCCHLPDTSKGRIGRRGGTGAEKEFAPTLRRTRSRTDPIARYV